MIVTLQKNAPKDKVEQLFDFLKEKGLSIVNMNGNNYDVFGVVGDTASLDISMLTAFSCVLNVQRIAVPYKKVSRYFHQEDTIVDINGIKIGRNEKIVIIGGPCAVESQEQIIEIAKEVKNAGGKMLRGGAYKPRTSPYSFQGLEHLGIEYLVKAREETKLPIVSEITAVSQIDEFVKNVDLLQVGARNMQNFQLLKALGKINKPILLKRGLANTIEEWLMAAEYIMASGNPNVILCERGIRTFETATRNTLDISVIPLIKKLTHLPIIIDPSHATGRWDLVEAVSLAAIAAGADGLIIEVHNKPECALSDGGQSLKPEKFANLIKKGRAIAQVLDRDI